MDPDSYTRTALGACVRRARLAAVDGIPIPTKHTAPSRNMRTAAMVMISSDVYAWITDKVGRAITRVALFHQRIHEQLAIVSGKELFYLRLTRGPLILCSLSAGSRSRVGKAAVGQSNAGNFEFRMGRGL